MAVRRINYYMLSNLRDRLRSLGPDDGGPVCYEDLPLSVISSPWFEQREYFKTVLELAYCVWCKLPIARADACDSGTDICQQHYESNTEAWERLRERRKMFPLHRSSNARGQGRYQRRKEQRERVEVIRVELNDIKDRAELNQTDKPAPTFGITKILETMKKRS
jgi:hypothetical protein